MVEAMVTVGHQRAFADLQIREAVEAFAVDALVRARTVITGVQVPEPLEGPLSAGRHYVDGRRPQRSTYPGQLSLHPRVVVFEGVLS